MPTPITHDNLGKGMDQFHPENRIPDGYWQDILNGDPTPEGTVRTRKGYQRYAGSIPIRVISVTRSGTNLDFTLDSSFDLTSLRSTPIVVYGRLSAAQTGDLSTTTTYKNYTGFTVSSGKIRVTDSASGTYSDTAPQLCIYGIDWSANIRASGAGSRWGWVNALDTYRSALETRVVCGLGGNFFAAYTYNEAGSDVGMPRVYPSIRGTADGDQVIGPALVSVTGSRTRGDISSTGVAGGAARCTSATFDSGSGYVDFVLDMPGMAVNGTLADIIAVGGDWLSVSNMPSALNGTWLIRAVVQGTDELTIRCEVDDVVDGRYDVTEADGLAGVYTDAVELTAAAKFDAGDRVQSTHLDVDLAIAVVGTDGTTVYVGGLQDTTYSISNAEVLYGTRTSQVLVPRDSGGTGTVANLVRGDMLEIVGYTRRIRVVNINGSADRTVNIATSGGFATATITSGDDTSNLAVGDVLRLRGAGSHDGDVTISEIVSSTELSWEAEETSSATGATVVGLSVGLDEAIELADDSGNSTYVQPHARWLPIEWSASETDTTKTHVRHMDVSAYDEQAFVRSAMAQDSLFLTDGENDVLKFDGTNLTRAGLFRWQPILTATLVPGLIGMRASKKTVPFSAVAGQSLTVTAADEKVFEVGERIVARPSSSTSYEEIVTTVTDNATSTSLMVADDTSKPSGASIDDYGSGSVYSAITVKYYARLQVVDANNNVVASAHAQSNDVMLRIGTRSTVHLTFIRPPLIGLLDTSRIELQVYRSGGSYGEPPYFQVYSSVFNYANFASRIHFDDTFPPDLLAEAGGGLDPTSVVIAGELGTAWECPPRGKYVAATAGRLLLGNLRSYPQFNIVIRKKANKPALVGAAAVGTKFIFRRASNAITTTNNSDTMVYELVGAANVVTLASAKKLAPGTDGESFTIDVSSSTGASTSSIAAGSWIYLTVLGGRSKVRHGANGGTYNYGGWWQVRSKVGSTITVKRANTPAALPASSFTDTGDLVNFASAHGITTGTPVWFAGGTLPTGLSNNTKYFARAASSTSLTLHSTYTDAITNSTPVTFTTGASGTNNLYQGDIEELPSAIVLATSNSDIPVFIEDNLSADYYYDTNYDTVGGAAANHTTDACDLVVARRLALAINASMSQVDPGLYPSFTPWLVAGGGNDFGAGQVVVTCPTSGVEPTFQHSSVNVDVYVGGVLIASGTEGAAQTQLFPSRVARSYANYPEVFDAPYALSPLESDSIIDVNPNDGDYMTGLVDFYGESNFAQSTNEAVVIVAKNRSMYAVNVETRQFQPLRTGGRGCTYPRSLRATPDGVVFANEDGLWLIGRDLQVTQIGKYMSRKWREAVQHDADGELVCSIYVDSKWHVSVPVASEDECDEVYVVDTTEAEDGSPRAAWSRYNNFPVTGWATAGRDVLFGTTAGLVHTRRRGGDASDYRDDAAEIEGDWLYKAVNFGSGGLRKLLHSLAIGFRVVTATTRAAVSMAADLVASYRSAGAFTLLDASDLEPTDVDTGIDDRERAIVRTVRFSPPRRRANYFQLRIQSTARDEPVEVTQLDWYVDPLTDAGTETATQTRNPNR